MLVVLAVALVANAVDAVHNAPPSTAAASTTSRCPSVSGQYAPGCGWGARAGGSPLLARNAADGGAGAAFYGPRRGDCRWMAPAERAACRQAASAPAAP